MYEANKYDAVDDAILAKALTGRHGLAGQDLQGGGAPSEDWKVAALFDVIMPVHHLLLMEMCNLILKLT